MKYIASIQQIVHKFWIVPKRSCFNNFDLCLCYSSKGGATFHFISPFINTRIKLWDQFVLQFCIMPTTINNTLRRRCRHEYRLYLVFRVQYHSTYFVFVNNDIFVYLQTKITGSKYHFTFICKPDYCRFFQILNYYLYLLLHHHCDTWFVQKHLGLTRIHRPK